MDFEIYAEKFKPQKLKNFIHVGPKTLIISIEGK